MTLRTCVICCGFLVLSACAGAPSTQTPTQSPHQDPSNPNPAALPDGVLEWVNYVCNEIPDPEARKQAIKDSAEQRGWIFTCPDDRSAGGDSADAASAAK